MVIGSEPGGGSSDSSGGWSVARGLVVKTLVLIGGALVLKRLTKSTTRWDHARLVSRSISGEKFSKDQAARDPDHYFNIRLVQKSSFSTTQLGQFWSFISCSIQFSSIGFWFELFVVDYWIIFWLLLQDGYLPSS